MDYQEMLLATMTASQRRKYELTKKVVAEFVNFKKYCEDIGEPLNVEGFCRVMGKESGVSALKVRRILWSKELIKIDKYGKGCEDTSEDPAFRSLQACRGSEDDGHSQMHTV